MSLRSLKVQVLPSGEISGIACAPSGTIFRLLSNLYRPVQTSYRNGMSPAATPSSVFNFASPKSSFRANLALRRAKSGPKRLPGLVLQDPKARPVVVVKRVAARTLHVRMHQVLLHPIEQATED